jgi:hypothetical protein
MNFEKSYFKTYDYDFNHLGVIRQTRHTSCLVPIDDEKIDYWGSGGGWLKPLSGQKGWRIRLRGDDACGGYEISVGSFRCFHFYPKDSPIDCVVKADGTIRIDPVGMVSGWSPLIISRVY